MAQRVRHIYDPTSTGLGTIVSMSDAAAIVLVEWDMKRGKSHPCLRQELLFLDEGDRVRPKRVPFRDREDRGSRGGRGDRDNDTFVRGA